MRRDVTPVVTFSTKFMRAPAKNVDAYIAAAPEDVRGKLTRLRKIVRAAAPEASESISYAMPYYKYHGALLGFAAFKNHIGLYGALPDAERHEFELKGYETSKGTVRFPSDKPLPVALIKKLIKARMKKNAGLGS